MKSLICPQKLRWFSFCFLLFSIEAYCQNTGVSFSPEISYRNFVKTDFVPGIDQFIEENNDLSESIVGFTAEVFFVKPFARKLSFETGLSFSRDGYNSFIRNLTPESLFLSGVLNSDDPGFDSTNEIETQNRFLSVGIPFRLAYIAEGKNLKFTWSLGVTPEYLLESSSTRIYKFASGEQESFNNDFESAPANFNLTASLSAGVELPINRTSTVRIEPVLRYGVFPTFNEEAYEVNIFSYGLSLKYLFRVGFPY